MKTELMSCHFLNGVNLIFYFDIRIAGMNQGMIAYYFTDYE